MKTTLFELKEMLADAKEMFTAEGPEQARLSLVKKYGMSESNANFLLSVASVDKKKEDEA